MFTLDIILTTPVISDWEYIRKQNKKLIDKNNQLENHKPHTYRTYRIRDKVLVRNKISNKYEDPYLGPYPIT